MDNCKPKGAVNGSGRCAQAVEVKRNIESMSFGGSGRDISGDVVDEVKSFKSLGFFVRPRGECVCEA